MEKLMQREKGKSIVIEDEKKNMGQSQKFPLLLSFSSEEDDHADVYDPITNRVTKINLNMKSEWKIIGHNPFGPWVMFQKTKEIWIFSSVCRFCLSPLPDNIIALPRFGYVFDRTLSILVCFGKVRFVVYWHIDGVGWMSREFVEPEHCPDGFVVFEGKLKWINTADATLHVLTNLNNMEMVEHESYALTEKFQVAQKMRSVMRFSAVIDDASNELYFVRKWTRVDAQPGLWVYYWSNYTHSFIEIKPDLNGLTFFVADSYFGFALKMGMDLDNTMYYAGIGRQDCSLIDWMKKPLEIQPKKSCNREICCQNLWFLCDNESQIQEIFEMLDAAAAADDDDN